MSIDTTQQESEPDTAQLESLYERMLQIRLLEDAVHRLFLTNEIEGTTHLYQGQEAVAVGVCDVLEPGDTVAATYRGHGAALALGVDQTALLAELLGRETGTNGGRGGSMNVIALEHGLIGCFGIVGGSIAAATGAALASQLQRGRHDRGRVLRRRRHEPGVLPRMPQLRGRAGAPGRLRLREQPLRRVDLDVPRDRRRTTSPPGRRLRHARASRSTATTCSPCGRRRARPSRARARAQGPTLLEAQTYRHKGHSRVDPGKYRPKEEVDEWLDARPAAPARRAARRGAVERIQTRVEAELELALSVARAAACPTPTRRRTALQGVRRPMARGQLPRGDPRRPRRGDGARPERLLIGEDVEPGGVFNATPGLVDRFGQRPRHRHADLRAGLHGAAFGAAVKGLRPVVEIMFADFLGLVLDTLVNQASKYWYLSDEQASVPLVVRSRRRRRRPLRRLPLADADRLVPRRAGPEARRAVERRRREGPDEGGDPRRQPGDRLRAQDALRAQGRRAGRRGGARPDRQGGGARGRAQRRHDRRCARDGRARDAAAEQLAGEGIEAEVIDLRTLRPLDADDDRRLRREDRAGSSSSRRARPRAATPPTWSRWRSSWPGRSAPSGSRCPTSRFRSARRSRTGRGRRPPRSPPPRASSQPPSKPAVGPAPRSPRREIHANRGPGERGLRGRSTKR